MWLTRRVDNFYKSLLKEPWKFDRCSLLYIFNAGNNITHAFYETGGGNSVKVHRRGEGCRPRSSVLGVGGPFRHTYIFSESAECGERNPDISLYHMEIAVSCAGDTYRDLCVDDLLSSEENKSCAVKRVAWEPVRVRGAASRRHFTTPRFLRWGVPSAEKLPHHRTGGHMPFGPADISGPGSSASPQSIIADAAVLLPRRSARTPRCRLCRDHRKLRQPTVNSKREL